jgi:hypothetical protein
MFLWGLHRLKTRLRFPRVPQTLCTRDYLPEIIPMTGQLSAMRNRADLYVMLGVVEPARASQQAQRKKTDPGPANRSPDPDRVGNNVLGRPFQAACRLCWYQCAARRIPASKPTPGSRRRSDRSGCVEDVISRQHVECGRRSAVLRKDRPRACPTVSSSSGQGVAVTLADGAQHGVRRDGRRVSGVMDGRRGRLPRGAPPPWGRRPRRR